MFKVGIVLVTLMFVGLSFEAPTQKTQQGHTVLEISASSKFIHFINELIKN